ncbi:MAG: hypothetical protein ACREDU_12960, partial [Methylocella sp.]
MNKNHDRRMAALHIARLSRATDGATVTALAAKFDADLRASRDPELRQAALRQAMRFIESKDLGAAEIGKLATAAADQFEEYLKSGRPAPARAAAKASTPPFRA